MAAGTAPVELRSLEDDELVTKLTEAKEELFNLRFQAATGQLESHGRLKAIRKDIARIYTVLTERALGIICLRSEALVPIAQPRIPQPTGKHHELHHLARRGWFDRLGRQHDHED